MNFDYFQTQKWMLQTVRGEKVDEKNGVICLIFVFPSWDFLLRSAQNCKKCNFLDNLRTITQEGNMETRQMTPFFSSTFSDLTVCNIHFWTWKYSKFIFMWSTLWFILVCKVPQFLAKSYRFRQLIILF